MHLSMLTSQTSQKRYTFLELYEWTQLKSKSKIAHHAQHLLKMCSLCRVGITCTTKKIYLYIVHHSGRLQSAWQHRFASCHLEENLRDCSIHLKISNKETYTSNALYKLELRNLTQINKINNS